MWSHILANPANDRAPELIKFKVPTVLNSFICMDGSDAPCFKAVFATRVVLVILVDDVNCFQTFWYPLTYYYLQNDFMTF